MKAFKILPPIFAAVLVASSLFAGGKSGIAHHRFYVGYGYFDYDEINTQLSVFHQIDGIKTLPNLGYEVGLEYSKILVSNQISTSLFLHDKQVSQLKQNVLFWEWSDFIKIGYPIAKIYRVRIMPFAGVLFQFQSIRTDFNYGIRSPNCFFQYKHDYNNFTSGLIYGITSDANLFTKKALFKNFSLGLELCGVIPLQNTSWWIDGEKIEGPESIPKSHFRYFANLKLIYQF